MTAPILATTTIFCILLTAVQTTSIAIAIHRLRWKTRHRPSFAQHPLVSLVRPLCGIDDYVAETLRSTFELDYPCYEILFCVARASDPILPLVKSLIAAHPNVSARLLIGDNRVSTNPKLNNVVKGWRAASHPWIVIADSNVLMPRDYIQRLFASWRADTGLVASPPIGDRPDGFGPKSNALSSIPKSAGRVTYANVNARLSLRVAQKAAIYGLNVGCRYLA
jgi:ceramide glucosyltransferase